MVWVTWPTFQFWDPLYISGTAKDKKLDFILCADRLLWVLSNACKIKGQKGVASVTWPTFKFWDTLNISETAKGRNVKFDVRIDFDECDSKNAKLGNKRGVAYVTWLAFEFWDPLYISGKGNDRNLKFGVRIDYDEQYSKKRKIRGQKRRGLGHVTYCSISGPPQYVWKG